MRNVSRICIISMRLRLTTTTTTPTMTTRTSLCAVRCSRSGSRQLQNAFPTCHTAKYTIICKSTSAPPFGGRSRGPPRLDVHIACVSGWVTFIITTLSSERFIKSKSVIITLAYILCTVRRSLIQLVASEALRFSFSFLGGGLPERSILGLSKRRRLHARRIMLVYKLITYVRASVCLYLCAHSVVTFMLQAIAIIQLVAISYNTFPATTFQKSCDVFNFQTLIRPTTAPATDRRPETAPALALVGHLTWKLVWLVTRRKSTTCDK